ERDAGREFYQIGKILDVQLIHPLRGEGAYAGRDPFDVFGAAGGRYHDLFNPAGARGGSLRDGVVAQQNRCGERRKAQPDGCFCHPQSPSWRMQKPCWAFAAAASTRGKASIFRSFQSPSNSPTARCAWSIAESV